jgi:Na+-transporting NADH:ubiquinone oxidoreductase subunit NqrB
MEASVASAPAGRTFVLRGRSFPLLLPSLRDARLHLAAVIVSLQVLGQTSFAFRLSIAQILIAVGTCAVLEVGIAFRKHGVIMWPASALLTGNGVAFILRVPGTEHGDWWSLKGWWVFAATAAVSLLSKHLIRFNGTHVFNPSNVGLVLCFLALGPRHAEPLDFWWGPMSAWMALALAIIVLGGLAILLRLRLLEIAVAFWVAFAAAIGVLAATGHAMTARWHLGPIEGLHFWRILLTSPEILVFLFFMITDPKTVPTGRRRRVAYAVAVALLAALLIAPARTEYWSKVAVLAALTLVCLARPLLRRVPLPHPLEPRTVALAVGGALALYAGALSAAGIPARPTPEAATAARSAGPLPPITVLPSKGVDSKLNGSKAQQIGRDVMAGLGPRGARVQRLYLWLEIGTQGGSTPVARVVPGGEIFELSYRKGRYLVGKPSAVGKTAKSCEHRSGTRRKTAGRCSV